MNKEIIYVEKNIASVDLKRIMLQMLIKRSRYVGVVYRFTF